MHRNGITLDLACHEPEYRVRVADEPLWFQPGYKPTIARRPSEPLWTVQKDGRHVRCELRDHGDGWLKRKAK